MLVQRRIHRPWQPREAPAAPPERRAGGVQLIRTAPGRAGGLIWLPELHRPTPTERRVLPAAVVSGSGRWWPGLVWLPEQRRPTPTERRVARALQIRGRDPGGLRWRGLSWLPRWGRETPAAPVERLQRGLLVRRSILVPGVGRLWLPGLHRPTPTERRVPAMLQLVRVAGTGPKVLVQQPRYRRSAAEFAAAVIGERLCAVITALPDFLANLRAASDFAAQMTALADFRADLRALSDFEAETTAQPDLDTDLTTGECD